MTRASNQRSVRATACQSVTLVIHSTWGDAYYVGLTALEPLDGSLARIPILTEQLDAEPRDLNEVAEGAEDPRTLDKILDGVTCTTDEQHMWLAPFMRTGQQEVRRGVFGDGPLQCNILRVDFGVRQEVAGFNIWNYNKNIEDTCRGVKEFSVYCDEKYIATFLCRKAPGHVHFDFKQVILLDQPPRAELATSRSNVPSIAPRLPSRGRSSGGARASSRERTSDRPSSRDRPRSASRERRDRPSDARPLQQYETPTHPCGFVFKFVLRSTWSDVHYIGLDGVELYDVTGQLLMPRQVHSNHGSVRNLAGMECDIRTEENLLPGPVGSSERMWLAPYCRNPPNTIDLVFDEPTQVSFIRFRNYSRTPQRGVRDVEVYVDDLLVYQGILRQSSTSRLATLAEEPNAPQAATGEVVFFTSQPEIVTRERDRIYLPSADELVSFFDETVEMDSAARALLLDGAAQRPMTALMR